MPTKTVTSYYVDSGIVYLNFSENHGLTQNTYFSVRSVDSLVNGQFNVLEVLTPTSLSYEKLDASNKIITEVNGSVIYTTINYAGKPAYVYDESADTWYQVSGKVNTNGNYSWTGTHLFQAPVTMEDVLTLSNISASVSSSPVGGGYIYVEDGELKFKGGNGTITTIAPA